MSPDSLRVLILAFAALAAAPADAQQPVEGVIAESSEDPALGQAWSHVGLLRARDLNPFGLLRLDMQPARTADAQAGVWTAEIQLAYQNTLVMSSNVRDYLASRGPGRRPVTEQDAAAILALPGDAYLFDGEIGLADLTVQRQLDEFWGVYLTVPYLYYGTDLLDSTIEKFHDALGFDQMNRDLLPRGKFNIVYHVDGMEVVQLGRQVRSGFGDPVLGVRYSYPRPRLGWDIVAEAAVKIAVDGERFMLSTGRHDVGAQFTAQRRLGADGRHAVYIAGNVVYFAGRDTLANESQVIPTVIGAYSFGLTRYTSLILQGYASRSAVQNSNLQQLTANKYMVSLGVQLRGRNLLWSFGITENVYNLKNTPDVGVQLGLAYVPKAQ